MNGKLEHVGEAATRDILLDDVGRDLGTKLDWVAVDHWNTDSGIPAGRSNRSAAMRLTVTSVAIASNASLRASTLTG